MDLPFLAVRENGVLFAKNERGREILEEISKALEKDPEVNFQKKSAIKSLGDKIRLELPQNQAGLVLTKKCTLFIVPKPFLWEGLSEKKEVFLDEKEGFPPDKEEITKALVGTFFLIYSYEGFDSDSLDEILKLLSSPELRRRGLGYFLIEIVANAFADILYYRLRQGPHMSYEVVEEESSTVRGKILFERAFRRYPGREHKLDVRYYEGSYNNLLNQIFLYVAKITEGYLSQEAHNNYASREAKDSHEYVTQKTRAKIHAIYDLLNYVNPKKIRPWHFSRVQFNRLSERFKVPFELARLLYYLIELKKPLHVLEEVPPLSFIYWMPKVFEDFLCRSLSKASNGKYQVEYHVPSDEENTRRRSNRSTGGVSKGELLEVLSRGAWEDSIKSVFQKERVWPTEGTTVRDIPDILIEQKGEVGQEEKVFAIVDAKYSEFEVKKGHLSQVSLYLNKFNSKIGALVYFDGGGDKVLSLRKFSIIFSEDEEKALREKKVQKILGMGLNFRELLSVEVLKGVNFSAEKLTWLCGVLILKALERMQLEIVNTDREC